MKGQPRGRRRSSGPPGFEIVLMQPHGLVWQANLPQSFACSLFQPGERLFGPVNEVSWRLMTLIQLLDDSRPSLEGDARKLRKKHAIGRLISAPCENLGGSLSGFLPLVEGFLGIGLVPGDYGVFKVGRLTSLS